MFDAITAAHDAATGWIFETLLQPAMAQNVAFMPGEPFFVDPDANPGHLRLNFSHVPPEKLGEGLRRLAAVIREAQAALDAQGSK